MVAQVGRFHTFIVVMYTSEELPPVAVVLFGCLFVSTCLFGSAGIFYPEPTLRRSSGA